MQTEKSQAAADLTASISSVQGPQGGGTASREAQGGSRLDGQHHRQCTGATGRRNSKSRGHMRQQTEWRASTVYRGHREEEKRAERPTAADRTSAVSGSVEGPQGGKQWHLAGRGCGADTKALSLARPDF